MRPVRVTVSSQAASKPIPMDHYIGPFNVGLGAVVAAGSTLSYDVEHTFDDINDPNFDADTAAWFPNSGMTGRSASTDGNYAFPVTAIRINVTAYTAGSVTLTAVQAGRTGG